MEKLTIYLDRMFAGGEIRDSQNIVVYRLERAYNPLASPGGPGMPGGGQDEGLTGLGRKLGGWAQGIARNRAIVRDVLSNTGFVLETAHVLTRGDLDDEHLKKIYKVKKKGPFMAYLHIDQEGFPQGVVPEKVTALDGKLLAWGRCPAGQWVKRRYLLQSPDGEILMETRRKSWRKHVFSIHRSATGEEIGWLRHLWSWYWLVIPFRGRHRYELEFWGEGRERLRTVALSLCIARMEIAGTRGGGSRGGR